MNTNHSDALYIGLISGTSVDAVDCVLADFQNQKSLILDFINIEIPPELKQQILNLCGDGQNQIQALGELDIKLGRLFAQAVLDLLKKNQLSPKQICAIGSHGQTIRHQPPDNLNKESFPFTLQIADPNTIAALTGITTVADFRRKDMAVGGEGAPLVPAFHREIFTSESADRIILNIGGMSNLTILPKDGNTITGFDTGPGNVLMDIWVQKHKQQAFDYNGDWAATGNIHKELLELFLEDEYFGFPSPKSTGRERFNEQWMNARLSNFPSNIAPEDIQATLLELTTISICDAIKPLLSSGELIVCGGGANNGQIMHSLKDKLDSFQVSTSTDEGLNGDSVEALAFAWLAKQTMERTAVDYTSITGASHPIIMGGVYYSE